MTGAEAIAKARAAVDYGELAGANAPSSHPVRAATERARELWEWLTEELYWDPSRQLGANVAGQVEATTGAVYAAADTLRIDPDRPLPGIRWSSWAPDWRWGVGVAAGIGALWLLFREDV